MADNSPKKKEKAPMVQRSPAHLTPNYQGLEWVEGTLPTQARSWLKPSKTLMISPGGYTDEATLEEVKHYAQNKLWVWPGERLYLLSDVHADTDALFRCLLATGGVRKTGPRDEDFELTSEGEQATFLIAGDCFDKGPENLRMLRAVRMLMEKSERVVLLAGNHDVRALIGVTCAGERDPQLAHLFVRMGKKAVPLFKELCDHYVTERDLRAQPKNEQVLHRALFPDDEWFEVFPKVAGPYVSPEKLQRELTRIREKMAEFQTRCAEEGLTMRHIHAAVAKFRELFMTPSGEFGWFFERMQLCHRVGSLLFVHAGIDDVMAELLLKHGTESINARFKDLLHNRDLYELYHGPIGNMFRTKYRPTDHLLTPTGVAHLHRAGVYGIVHGHRSIEHGQRIIFRSGMLNIECDATVDINSRRLTDLPGLGAAATLFNPDGKVLGISTDHPTIKVFEPATVASLVTVS